MDIYTIIFAALAVVICLRLRSVLGQRTWVSGDDDDSGDAWQRVRLQAFINSGGRIRL